MCYLKTNNYTYLQSYIQLQSVTINSCYRIALLHNLHNYNLPLVEISGFYIISNIQINIIL